jgi:hypothetical protein
MLYMMGAHAPAGKYEICTSLMPYTRDSSDESVIGGNVPSHSFLTQSICLWSAYRLALQCTVRCRIVV